MKGLLTGLVVGLILAVVLFAIDYGRIDLVHELAFGTTYRSNVDRPPSERSALQRLADRVQILRLRGFAFFGTASRILERIHARTASGPIHYLVIDVERVTGIDASAVLVLRKITQLAEADGFELVFAGAPEPVVRQLHRGGVGRAEGVVAFEPDLDHALERCEDALLSGANASAPAPERAHLESDGDGMLPADVIVHLERTTVPEGTVLIHEGDPPDDVYVVESGRLRVETTTPSGTRMRLSTVRGGVVVGEIALYTGVPRTADVIAETDSVVLRLSRASIERIETEDPDTAARLHRWLARVLAERLTDSERAYSSLLE
jgi:SulP family sulfate permease